MSLKLMLHSLLCAAIFFVVFCRLAHMDRGTCPKVVAATSTLGMAVLFLGISPFVWRLWPWWGRITLHWTELVLLGVILVRLLLTMNEWRAGVPHRFRRAAEPQPPPLHPGASVARVPALYRRSR